MWRVDEAMKIILAEYQVVLSSGDEHASYDIYARRREIDESLERPLDTERTRSAVLAEVEAS